MTKKLTVILPTAGQFRRTVRKDGKPVLDELGNPRVIVFNSRQPVELDADELESVRDDIGNVLHIAKAKEGAPAVKVDGEATAKFLAETKELRAKQAAQAAAEKDATKGKPAKADKPAPATAPAPLAHHAASHKDHETKGK